jgi:phosphorylated CTD-interacting factor 1
MALGKQTFNVLRMWFDVQFECFASPLNCTCSAYALMFPLTDWCFSALGNFFLLRPSSGSFKANPPFIAEVMLAMVVHIHKLLHDATGLMSFVVIVPGWDDDPSWSEV